ncbi:hypothetical protein K502DRAFT_325832 [Neoconidiobolus thromboides FSU 785]|nr:hypothetical protein K502DRAFT_325832 [Neoconidiobolus thromboides FSU 785]
MKEKKNLVQPKITIENYEIYEVPSHMENTGAAMASIFATYRKSPEEAEQIYIRHKRFTLDKIFGYYHHYKDYQLTTEEIRNGYIKEWDAQHFPTQIEALVEMIMACQELDLELCLEATCRLVAAWMRNKPLDEIRKALKIEYDFDPKHEKERESSKEFALRRFNRE